MHPFDLYHADCLAKLPDIANNSIDLILADPPYGTTQCAWDSPIELAQLWPELKRITRPGAPIVLMAAQPFTSVLIASNLAQFRYCWVWDKVDKYTNQLNAKHQPMRRHEEITVFCKTKPNFYPIKRAGSYVTRQSAAPKTEVYGKSHDHSNGEYVDGLCPCSVLEIPAHKQTTGLHPTEKPVSLMEYLIKTYTNPGECVLDFCMGSGSTGAACMNLGRKFIGIEQNKKYFTIARERIAAHNLQLNLFD